MLMCTDADQENASWTRNDAKQREATCEYTERRPASKEGPA
jgi:hypothetical protein